MPAQISYDQRQPMFARFSLSHPGYLLAQWFRLCQHRSRAWGTVATVTGAIALVPQAAIAQGAVLEPNVPRTEPRRARQEQLQQLDRQLDTARERQLQRFEPRRNLESDRNARQQRSREFRQQVRQNLRQQSDRLERRQQQRRRELLRRQSR